MILWCKFMLYIRFLRNEWSLYGASLRSILLFYLRNDDSTMQIYVYFEGNTLQRSLKMHLLSFISTEKHFLEAY